MKKIFKIGIVSFLAVSVLFILLLRINPLVKYERTDELYRGRSQEELKKIEDNFNTFKTTGSCPQCDFGVRSDNEEKKDLRQVVQLIRSKGLPINLFQAFLIYVNLAHANLSGANLSDVDLSYSDLSGANLAGANLSGASLYGANLIDADLTDAILVGASLYHADLQKANLTGANLHRADLGMSNLSGANLTRANLTNALLRGTTLDGTIVTGADLRGALIYMTDLTHVVDFAHAQWDGVIMRSLRAFSWWLNFVCSTIIPGIKLIAKSIKFHFLYYKHWLRQKSKGGTPIPKAEFFEMQNFKELYPLPRLEK